jgi:hypothetical protein
MRLFSLVIIPLFIFSLSSAAQKKTLNQTIAYVKPYCGGARPTPEMEADAQKPKPYAHKTIIIIAESGKVDSVKTDKDGNFKKALKYGKYRLFEHWRYYKKTPDGSDISIYDKDCLGLEWKKEFKSISIDKTKITEEEKYQINSKCPWSVPCILEKYLPPRMRE